MDHPFGVYIDYGYAPHVGYDGLGPMDYGHAVLASGNVTIVESNGDVSAIVAWD